MDYEHMLVNEFCNQTAKLAHGYRQMCNFYIFHDKRSGSLEERFNLDAQLFADYQKLFQP